MDNLIQKSNLHLYVNKEVLVRETLGSDQIGMIVQKKYRERKLKFIKDLGDKLVFSDKGKEVIISYGGIVEIKAV